MYKKVNVVMLPTNEKANLYLEKDKLLLYVKNPEMLDGINIKGYQHLYILSDEKIKESDWITDGIKVIQASSKIVNAQHLIGRRDWKKIIATTDKSLTYYLPEDINKIGAEHNLSQPSEAFIQKFIEEYNKSNVITEVMVEYETKLEWCYSHSGNRIQEESDPFLKINPKDNTINIKPIKDSWNREEVINLLKLHYNEFAAYPTMNLDLRDKWIEKNL